MEEQEKLPEYNPVHVCPKCGKSYTIWQYYFNSQEGKVKVGHSFCPKPAPGGKIINICIDCRVQEIKDGWHR